jgi:2-phosphoglycerate kinase
VKEVEELSGWDSLVLPKGHKEIVVSLVQAHFGNKQQATGNKDIQVDLVRGKGINSSPSYTRLRLTLMVGKGLIILLHGAPGVGKTSTAGTVRYLQVITAADQGYRMYSRAMQATSLPDHVRRFGYYRRGSRNETETYLHPSAEMELCVAS